MTHETVNGTPETVDFRLSRFVTNSLAFKDQVDMGLIASDGLLNEPEVKTLLLLALGFEHEQIGEALSRTKLSIKSQLSRKKWGIFTKLGVSEGFEAVANCLALGIIQPEGLVHPLYEKRLKSLSDIERNILDYSILLHGNGVGEAIAETIYYSPGTVKNNFNSTAKKLGARNRLHVRAMHMAYGMIKARNR